MRQCQRIKYVDVIYGTTLKNRKKWDNAVMRRELGELGGVQQLQQRELAVAAVKVQMGTANRRSTAIAGPRPLERR